MATRRSKSGWGGRRAGSGRKPILDDPRRVTFDLEVTELEALQELAQRQSVSVAALLRKIVRAYIGRRRGRT